MVDAFDSEYFKLGRFFILEEWNVKMPIGKDGEYTPIGIKDTHLVRVNEFSGSHTFMEVTVLDSCPVQSRLIRASLVIHGYYKFIPATVRREDEEKCT